MTMFNLLFPNPEQLDALICRASLNTLTSHEDQREIARQFYAKCKDDNFTMDTTAAELFKNTYPGLMRNGTVTDIAKSLAFGQFKQLFEQIAKKAPQEDNNSGNSSPTPGH